jgi:hypothetical protein
VPAWIICGGRSGEVEGGSLSSSSSFRSASVAGWIKWEKDLETDPRFTRVVRKLRDTSVTQALPVTTLLVGALVRLWSYADSHIRSDDTLDLGPDDIDDMLGVPGFCRALPDDWLTIIDEEHVELPGYQEHNGVEAKKRDLATKRQQRKRARDRHAPVTPVTRDSVTPALPDQTRPDQTKPDQSEREPHSRGETTRTESNPTPLAGQPGLIETGSNLTRSVEEWTATTGINTRAMKRWLGHLSTSHRWTLTPEQASLHAQQLVGNGDAAAQTEVIDWCIGANYRTLIPIADVRARKNGMRRPAPGGSDTKEAREQHDQQRLRKLMDGRAARGLGTFRDPYQHEKADAYETALRLAEQDSRGRKASA